MKKLSQIQQKQIIGGDEADGLKTKLEEAGAEVEIK